MKRKKFVYVVLVVICLMILLPVNSENEIKNKEKIVIKNNEILFSEFKEYLKSYPDGWIVIEKLHQFGITDDSICKIYTFCLFAKKGYGYVWPPGFAWEASINHINILAWKDIEDPNREYYTWIFSLSPFGVSEDERPNAGIAIIWPFGVIVSSPLRQQPNDWVAVGSAIVVVIFPLQNCCI